VTDPAQIQEWCSKEAARVISVIQQPLGWNDVAIRFHAITESFLDRIVVDHFNGGDRLLDDGRFTYAQKVTLVDSLGALEAGDVEILRKLNSLRNRCAHNAAYQVTKAELEAVAPSFVSRVNEIATCGDPVVDSFVEPSFVSKAKEVPSESAFEQHFMSYLMPRIVGKLLKPFLLMPKATTAEKTAEPMLVDWLERAQTAFRVSTMKGLILRFHLATEDLLDQLISGNLERGSTLLESGRLSYSQKVSLVLSFNNVDEDAMGVLQRVNGLRNKCVHRHDYAVTQDDLKQLAGPFSQEAREAADAHQNVDHDRAFFGWVMLRVFGKAFRALYSLEFFTWERRITGEKRPTPP